VQTLTSATRRPRTPLWRGGSFDGRPGRQRLPYDAPAV